MDSISKSIYVKWSLHCFDAPRVSTGYDVNPFMVFYFPHGREVLYGFSKIQWTLLSTS